MTSSVDEMRLALRQLSADTQMEEDVLNEFDEILSHQGFVLPPLSFFLSITFSLSFLFDLAGFLVEWDGKEECPGMSALVCMRAIEFPFWAKEGRLVFLLLFFPHPPAIVFFLVMGGGKPNPLFRRFSHCRCVERMVRVDVHVLPSVRMLFSRVLTESVREKLDDSTRHVVEEILGVFPGMDFVCMNSLSLSKIEEPLFCHWSLFIVVFLQMA